MDTTKEFTAKDLKDLRISLGLSLSEMAEVIGLTGENAADTVRFMECGKKAISTPIQKLCIYILRDYEHKIRSAYWTHQLMHKEVSPECIQSAREQAGLTQKDSAHLIYKADRTWRQYEGGDRKMDLALFELFLLKSKLM